MHLTVGQKQSEQIKKKRLKFYKMSVICCIAMERTGIVLAFNEFIEENHLTIIESIIFLIKGELEDDMTI